MFTKARLKAKRKPAGIPCVALRPSEAAAALSISPRTFADLLKTEDIPHFRVGEKSKRILIPVDGLREWAARKCQSARDL